MLKYAPKIAVVVPKYGLVGGGEGFAAELSAKIAENYNYEIHVFANKWVANSDKITFHKVPIITFPKWLTTVSFAWFANKKINKIGGFDLIHTHERIFKADICSMHFVPHSFWVKEIRGKKYPSLFDLATIWVERRMLSEPGSCEYMLPVSSLAANKFISEYPQFKGNIQVVYPGISENFKRTKNKNARQKIRCQFGISPSDFLLLFVGMNFKLKGLDQLLSAMVQIHKQTKNNRLKLLVVGKGNRQDYKAITQSLGIENEVIFAGVRHDMPAIYHSADAFALLSKFDTFGMVVTEAMSTGLPVIVSESVGAKDLVRNGENGFIVKHSETNELCLRLISLMKKKPQITASRNDMLLADLNWTNIAAKVVEKYETLCADS